MEQYVWRDAQVGIAIGEHGLIKEERRAGERLLGTVLLGRTQVCTHTRTYTVCTRTQSVLQASETLPLCVMAAEADMAEWLS